MRMRKEQEKMVSASQWLAMDDKAKRELLERGLCMVGQGVAAKDGQLRRWGTGFVFHDSPVPMFALIGNDKELAEALALGACPLAKDSEGDGIFEIAFKRMVFGQNETGWRLALMGWASIEPLLADPEKSGMRAEEVQQALFDIAVCAYQSKNVEEARRRGIPVSPKWLLSNMEELPRIAAHSINWGSAAQLRELAAAGLDYAKAGDPMLPRQEEEEVASLWEWLSDGQEEMEQIALFLWESGNDPRKHGAIAALDEAGEHAVAELARRIVLSSQERGELEKQASVPAVSMRKPKLRI